VVSLCKFSVAIGKLFLAYNIFLKLYVLLCAGVDVAVGPFVLSPPPKAPYQPRRLSSRAGKTAVISSSPYKNSLIESLKSKKVATPSRTKKPSKSESNKQSNPVASKTSSGSASKGKGKSKRSAPTVGTAPSSKRRRQQQKEPSSSDDEDEEWPCVVCGESFSRPREVWLQCQECKLWALSDCTAGDGYFICPNCESDDDMM